MRVLVTGGGGFLGAAICHMLRDQGHKVTSFSRGSYPDLGKGGIMTISGDIGDRRTVVDAVRGMDAVIHTAARVGFWGPYQEFHRTNVEGTRNVIEACRRNGVGYLVFTSSPSVVFDGKDMEGANEMVPYPAKHGSHYNRTKAASERMVLSANGDGLWTIALRPHLIWGPGDDRLLPRLVQGARAGRLRRLGDGSNVVDMVYIENAAEAHILALKALKENPRCRGRAYFITNGEPVNAWDAIDDFLALAGAPPIKGSIPKWTAMVLAGIMELAHFLLRRRGEPIVTRFLVEEMTSSHWFDISSAKRDLGYGPGITTAEGMKRYGEYLKDHSI